MFSRLFVRVRSHVRPGQIRAGFPAKPDDASDWQRANPAVGVTVSEAAMKSAQADAMRDRG